MNRRPAAWLVVMRREILAKLTDRSFLVGTLFTLVILAGVIGVQGYFSERTKTYDLVVTADARPVADQVAIAGAGGIRGARPQEFAEFQGIAVADELAIEVVKVDHVRHGGGGAGGGQGQDGGAGQVLGGEGTCCGSCLRMHDTSHEFSLDDYVGCNMFCVLEVLSRAAG